MRHLHEQRPAAPEQEHGLAVDAPRERVGTEEPGVAGAALARPGEPANDLAQRLHVEPS